MAAEIVEFDIEPEDSAELDRLIDAYGGDRDEFLREAIRVMSALAGAEGYEVP